MQIYVFFFIYIKIDLWWISNLSGIRFNSFPATERTHQLEFWACDNAIRRRKIKNCIVCLLVVPTAHAYGRSPNEHYRLGSSPGRGSRLNTESQPHASSGYWSSLLHSTLGSGGVLGVLATRLHMLCFFSIYVWLLFPGYVSTLCFLSK